MLLGRRMVRKSLVAGLLAVLVMAAGLLLGLLLGTGKRERTAPTDHFYSKAAVAADAGTCSEVGRYVDPPRWIPPQCKSSKRVALLMCVCGCVCGCVCVCVRVCVCTC